jgi:hypothetical protein
MAGADGAEGLGEAVLVLPLEEAPPGFHILRGGGLGEDLAVALAGGDGIGGLPLARRAVLCTGSGYVRRSLRSVPGGAIM